MQKKIKRKNYLHRKDLKPAENLERDFKALEDYILAHQSVDVFDELFKVIYAKLIDERINLKKDSSICEFRAEEEEHKSTVFDRIQNLLRKGINLWGNHQKGARIRLLPDVLKDIVLTLQSYYFKKTPKDVLGIGFEYLVTKVRKGEKGQYFTPSTVVRMMIRMAGVLYNKKILDPACGSAGFLLEALEEMYAQIETETQNPNIVTKKKNECSDRLFGLDYELKMTKIAKLNMFIRGDSKSNIFVEDSLKDYTWKSTVKRFIRKEIFDIILTNPPFAGVIKEFSTLRRFELAQKKGKLLSKQTRDVLFLEMCLNYLRPGGILAIVLPIGVFNNSTLKYVRDFIRKNARILASISLDPYIFAPHTGNRTGVLLLQKKRNSRETESYKIFMAISYNGGKRQGGRPLYKTTDKGEVIYDKKGRPTLDSDLDKIADAYLTKKVPNQLADQCFWIKSTELKDRLDPKFYHPKRTEFKKTLQRNFTRKPLKNFAKYMKRTIDPTKTPSKIFQYIELNYINDLGMIKKTNKILGKNAPSRARYLVKKGDIITAMSGSKTGSPTHHKATIITEEYNNCVVSTGFGILRPKKGVDLYYLYGLLRSRYVLSEMVCRLRGGGIPMLTKNDLMTIQVPEVSPKAQQEIGEAVKARVQAFKKAESEVNEIKDIWEEIFGFKEKEKSKD